jgi:hypothetical protein
VVPTRITLTLLADPEVFLEHPDRLIIATVANNSNNTDINTRLLLFPKNLALLDYSIFDPIDERSGIMLQSFALP